MQRIRNILPETSLRGAPDSLFIPKGLIRFSGRFTNRPYTVRMWGMEKAYTHKTLIRCMCFTLSGLFQQDIALNLLPDAHTSAFHASAAMKQYLAENPIKLRKISFHCRPGEAWRNWARRLNQNEIFRKTGFFDTLRNAGNRVPLLFGITRRMKHKIILNSLLTLP